MALTKKELELVAIGSSIGGNCIPCLEWHYRECEKLGISKQELAEAIAMAKKVKEVPNQKIYETAEKLSKQSNADNESIEPPSPCCCSDTKCC